MAIFFGVIFVTPTSICIGWVKAIFCRNSFQPQMCNKEASRTKPYSKRPKLWKLDSKNFYFWNYHEVAKTLFWHNSIEINTYYLRQLLYLLMPIWLINFPFNLVVNSLCKDIKLFVDDGVSIWLLQGSLHKQCDNFLEMIITILERISLVFLSRLVNFGHVKYESLIINNNNLKSNQMQNAYPDKLFVLFGFEVTFLCFNWWSQKLFYENVKKLLKFTNLIIFYFY